MAAKAPPNPKPKLEFTPDQVALIEKMGKEKATRKEMAAALGISVTSLRRHFRAQLGTRAPTVPQPKIIWKIPLVSRSHSRGPALKSPRNRFAKLSGRREKSRSNTAAEATAGTI